mgnify:CR=1 FL=1
MRYLIGKIYLFTLLWLSIAGPHLLALAATATTTTPKQQQQQQPQPQPNYLYLDEKICSTLLNAHSADDRIATMATKDACGCRLTESGQSYVVDCRLNELESCTAKGVCGFLTLEHRYNAGLLRALADTNPELEEKHINDSLMGYKDCVEYTQGKRGKDCVRETRTGEVGAESISVVQNANDEASCKA